MANDEDPFVRQQVAYSLGEMPAARAGEQLAQIIRRDGDDPHLLAAALSSLGPHIRIVLDEIEKADAVLELSLQALEGLIQTAIGNDQSAQLRG